MKIHCPMNPEYEPHAEELVALGASEFYLGYLNNLKDSVSILSLRLSAHSNFPSLERAGEAIARIKSLGARAFITINGPFYPESFFDRIVSDAAELSKSGADGFIISDINIMLKIREALPDVYMIISSGAHLTNSGAIEFYRSLGAGRCILPRQLDPVEISRIVANCPDMDFEIFMKNEECAFMDGYCSYSHYADLDEKPACNMLFTGDMEMKAGRTEMWSCGSCALFQMKNLENLSLKICGRSLRYDPIYKDVDYLRRVLEELKRSDDEQSFMAFCRTLHERIYGKSCGKKCYYNVGANIGARRSAR